LPALIFAHQKNEKLEKVKETGNPATNVQKQNIRLLFEK